jgi:glyoxylate/hydroxypyruvate reductase A
VSDEHRGTAGRSLRVLIASPLEPECAARVASIPGVVLDYRPDLLPPARFSADHGGDPAFRRSAQQDSELRALLAEAEVLFDLPREWVAEVPQLAPKLRYLQTSSSGIGQLMARSGLDPERVQVCNAAGIHAGPLTEFVLLALLHFVKRVPELQRAQAQHRWARLAVGELAGRTVLIIGLGAIGRQLARTLRMMGVHVLGVRRSPVSDPEQEGVDEAYTVAALPELLPRADALVIIAPHNPQSIGMIDAAALARLPRGALLINIGRGSSVDSDALLAALERGHLGGAALDVTDPEPLPPEHPLWSAPNLLITPHSAATVPAENGRLMDLFCDNLQRLLADQPLLNRWRA